MWFQKVILLKPRSRGFHLVTNEILDQLTLELQSIKIGMMNVFIQHTSASLTINENAAPDVRTDFESYFNHAVPENESYYKHLDEGADDMPAHIKASVLGCSLNIPITNYRPNLGTWQGIYLCEHRNYGGSRTILVTVNGV
jgi:secondary thiamine-phosphate synthase enzyme